LGRIEVESARQAILGQFLEHVIGGKGLSAGVEFERMVRMPTPEAVYEATRLLAGGAEGRPGTGEAIVIDVGGATTDVHSHRSTEAAAPGIEDPLLPPPATLRTVEGDLGLRAGAPGAYDVDRKWIASESGWGEARIRQAVSKRADDPGWIAPTREEGEIDGLLAAACATHALSRH